MYDFQLRPIGIFSNSIFFEDICKKDNTVVHWVAIKSDDIVSSVFVLSESVFFPEANMSINIWKLLRKILMVA